MTSSLELATTVTGGISRDIVIDAGAASYRLDWGGPAPLIGADGSELEVAPLIERAVKDVRQVPAVRAELTKLGVR